MSSKQDASGKSRRVEGSAHPAIEDESAHPVIESGVGVDDELPDDDILSRSEDTFAMLASSARLRLLWLLRGDEVNVTTLAEATDSSTQAVSQHLTKLRYAGLVAARRVGRSQLYRIDDPHIASLVEQMVDHHEDLRRRGR